MTHFNCLIIAGEQSGEEHLMSLMGDTLKKCGLKLWGVGGEQLHALAFESLYDLKEFSSMGFSEVIVKMKFYKQARSHILEECKKRKTTLAILVDFQGFNLSLVTGLHELGVHIHYLVAPQAWIWKPWRAAILAKTVKGLYCVLPFEQDWFRARGVSQAVAVVHPSYLEFTKSEQQPQDLQIRLTILPGSRNGEVSLLLPIFMQAVQQLEKKFNIVVTLVKSPSVKASLYQLVPGHWKQVESSQLKLILSETTVALAASGTVTLNCAFMEVPTVVCYKVNMVNEWIFRRFIRYKGLVSIPNLLLGEKIYPELLQEKCSPSLIMIELEKLCSSIECQKQMKQKLKLLSIEQEKLKKQWPEHFNAVLKEEGLC
jgi:lipid-A-disaccharide synthase